MIVITGAAGFIASGLVSKFNNKGIKNLILVDDFSKVHKLKNLENKVYIDTIDREVFFDWFNKNYRQVEIVFHLGARTDTAEFDIGVLNYFNFSYTKRMWDFCSEKNIPLVYASSAATYGNGENSYSDNHQLIPYLQPLNPYGVSKNEFDKYAIMSPFTPPYWAGLKFFNVYGPNEYHKSRMASVVFHAFHQIKKNKTLKLFKSHNSKFKDGEQLRDFIYVKDVTDVCFYIYINKIQSGIYNLGTGKARTFKDLGLAVFSALKIDPNIEYIDIPIDIRDKYQYYTQAQMKKLRKNGYQKEFTSLEDGIYDYIGAYLSGDLYY